MCILCGEFVSQIHWSERHVEDRVRAAGRDWSPGDYHRSRRRDRLRRVAVANRVLHHYGLKLSDFGASKYVLRDRKGRSELVQDLGSLWPAAQKLAGRTLDPLDPALQAALREAP